jgi:hypothetical protein
MEILNAIFTMIFNDDFRGRVPSRASAGQSAGFWLDLGQIWH